MPAFCAEFAWCSPSAFWALELEEYLALRDYLVKRSKATKGA